MPRRSSPWPKKDPEAATKGVDSVHTVDQATETAMALAEELKTVLAITGAVDLVTDGEAGRPGDEWT